MGAYILRRILLMIPTLFGIMAISFVVAQFAPGGPVEQMIAEISGANVSATSRVTGTEGGDFAGQVGDLGIKTGNVDCRAVSGFRGLLFQLGNAGFKRPEIGGRRWRGCCGKLRLDRLDVAGKALLDGRIAARAECRQGARILQATGAEKRDQAADNPGGKGA